MKNKKRKFHLTYKDVEHCIFFASEGRQCNAAKVQLTFRKGEKVVAWVAIYDDPKEKQVLVRWFNKHYYRFRYGHPCEHIIQPYTMTLAKYKQLNDRLS